MTKEEVIERLRKLNRELCDSQGQSWSLSIPPQETDPDMLIELAISMLSNATIWTPCEERMPDLEDANEDGYVNTQRRDGTTEIEHWDDVRKSEHIIAWSHIEPIQGGEA